MRGADPEQIDVQPVRPGPPGQPARQGPVLVQRPHLQRDFVLGGGGEQCTQAGQRGDVVLVQTPAQQNATFFVYFCLKTEHEHTLRPTGNRGPDT
ncbi:hypothetical protein SBADM41S_09447 [Streptomyces badius]